MADDKKADIGQLEKDMFAHFAKAEARANAEAGKNGAQTLQQTWRERFVSPSRAARISLVLFVVWTLYVFYRTWDYHELIGIDLAPWNSDYLFGNWLIVPVVLFVLYKAALWALHKK